MWKKCLHRILSKLGFVQSQVDECVYYRDGVIYLLYTDDSILSSRSEAKIRQAIIDIEQSGLKITIEESVEDFLGVHIQTLEGGKVKMSQPQLARQLCHDLGFKDNTKTKQIPAATHPCTKETLR